MKKLPKLSKAGKAFLVWWAVELILLVIISIKVGFPTALIVWIIVGALECVFIGLKYGWSSLFSGVWMIQIPVEFEEL